MRACILLTYNCTPYAYKNQQEHIAMTREQIYGAVVIFGMVIFAVAAIKCGH
jgi:hypothetical protein